MKPCRGRDLQRYYWHAIATNENVFQRTFWQTLLAKLWILVTISSFPRGAALGDSIDLHAACHDRTGQGSYKRCRVIRSNTILDASVSSPMDLYGALRTPFPSVWGNGDDFSSGA